jgi:hypothetical protein
MNELRLAATNDNRSLCGYNPPMCNVADFAGNEMHC